MRHFFCTILLGVITTSIFAQTGNMATDSSAIQKTSVDSTIIKTNTNIDSLASVSDSLSRVVDSLSSMVNSLSGDTSALRTTKEDKCLT